MHPVLIYIPIGDGFSIYTYGVLTALGYLCAILWTVHEGKLRGISSERVFDLGFFNIVFAIIGGRLLYALTEWERFTSNPLEIFKIWEGGLVFYGGLIACIIFSYFYTRKHHISMIAMADTFMPSVALGHGIGRLGCFFAGCCYGRPTDPDSILSVIFPHNPLCLAPTGIPLFATQFMEAAALLTLFMVLVWIRRHQRFSGQVFLSYLGLYAVMRAILETFRGDSVRGFIIEGVLSTSQFISALLVILTIILYIYLLRKKQSKAHRASGATGS
jgi:phosphatidylglycerol---prolipoprotein diacylglyceryl transferase